MSISGTQWLVRGADSREWVRVLPTELTISEVVEHGLHLDGVVRERRVSADSVQALVVKLPFRRRAWDRTVAVLCALTPAGLTYEGTNTRMYLEADKGGSVELGRREDWIVDKQLSLALEEWTKNMPPWSLSWTCSEAAVSAYLREVGGQRMPRRRLRQVITEMQSLGRPDDPPRRRGCTSPAKLNSTDWERRPCATSPIAVRCWGAAYLMARLTPRSTGASIRGRRGRRSRGWW